MRQPEPPLRLPARGRPGRRQDTAAGSPEPRPTPRDGHRDLAPPSRPSAGSARAPARGVPARSPGPAARSHRTWPAAAAALLLTYPFRISPFATQPFAPTGRRQQQPPGPGRMVPAAPGAREALLAAAKATAAPSPVPHPTHLPETGNGCTLPPIPGPAVTRGRGPLPRKPRPRRPREARAGADRRVVSLRTADQSGGEGAVHAAARPITESGSRGPEGLWRGA